MAFDDGQIVITREASPTEPGARWIWTLADGFTKSAPIAFAPDAQKGWADLRARTLDHPADLHGMAPIAAQLNAMMGADRAAVTRALTGPGVANFSGDWLFASACRAHMCSTEAGLVAASLRDKMLYLAYKLDGRKIVVEPAVGQWPKPARQALKEWAKSWK